MSTPQKTKIDELEWAFDLQPDPDFCDDTHCYISKVTGELVYSAEAATGQPCPVEDIEEHPDYIHLPDKHDLDLGQRLVWRFVGIEIPGLEQKVRKIFSRRGAYRRWKDFLDRNYLLDKWHTFENESKREALVDWCKAHGVPIEDSTAD
ncbi:MULTISPECIES: UPF0158 family protein [unclassified Lentimonas]|uniref:UPF0158 family protein n=1 Tax=unclassified Lentimonas TaxID=2630993 RepID=UPI0013245AFC|nr:MULTISPECIES: UPF0158 family protein [unclassified Lentimonas]CAA6677049.1 Unannotated [Lentimonas sp. CC4]CAA6687242.1 Unannotated [Lentimonas sp. CC6]CAA7074357.1 Unannotated [Lentimonas sp. CC4]CAA7171454.1 Unannotated [Lentimonas sp. CC21]CAA7180050.1 Unannotated [Lentimonas sp. CC8]